MTSAELAELCAAEKDGVTTTARLRDAGVTPHVIRSRCRADGPWRWLLPGVILLDEGESGRRQQARAAAYYAGAGSVITGRHALRAHGAPVAASRDVHVLVPTHRRVHSLDFVHLERTTRVPEPVRRGGIAFAPAARATIDLARREPALDRLRRLLALPVQFGLCTADELRAELDAGNQRGSAAVREMLRNLGSMESTYLHGAARQRLEVVPLPPPRWNVKVCNVDGKPIGVVDAWWDEVALGWQFTALNSSASKRSHLSLIAAGVKVVRTEPHQLRAALSIIPRELTSAFAAAARRRRPPVLALGSVPATI